MGEAIARSLLYERSIASEVASAGTEALDGMEATDGAKITARKLGLDLSEHRSRAVSGDLVAMADLVVAMEPRHVVDLVNEFDAALARTYTLPELADLVRRSRATPTSHSRRGSAGSPRVETTQQFFRPPRSPTRSAARCDVIARRLSRLLEDSRLSSTTA